MVLSPSFTSLHGSLASSINDLTAEAEMLERAIRHNDVKFVSKLIEQYFGKSGAERLSTGSRRSSRSNKQDSAQSAAQPAGQGSGGRRDSARTPDRPVLRSQMAFDEALLALNCEPHRQDTASTETRECQSIFANALHLAIENNALSVCVLLLRNGIDPNEPGVAPCTIDFWRRSSHTSDESGNAHLAGRGACDRLSVGALNLGQLSTSREPLIRTPSARSPMLLSPQAGGSFFGSRFLHHSPLYSANSSPSSVVSDLSSVCNYANHRYVRMRPELARDLAAVHSRLDGSDVTYEEEYSRERLFTLPPIFLVVALSNSAILRELLLHDTDVNAADAHGVTPLHLCLCQEHISRACLQLLVQAGAKLHVRNKKNVAPVELVERALLEEVTYLPTFLIDDSFQQLLLGDRSPPAPNALHRRLSKRDTLMHAHYKSVDYHNSDVDNSSSTLNSVLPAHASPAAQKKDPFGQKEESVDSASSSNLGRFLNEFRLQTGDLQARQKKAVVEQQLSASRSGEAPGSGGGRDVRICLERSNTIEQVPDHQPGSSLFFPTTISNLMGHKRSFACDSSTPAPAISGRNVSSTSLLPSSFPTHPATERFIRTLAVSFGSLPSVGSRVGCCAAWEHRL